VKYITVRSRTVTTETVRAVRLVPPACTALRVPFASVVAGGKAAIGDAAGADKLPVGSLDGCACLAGNAGCEGVNAKGCTGVTTAWLLPAPTAVAGGTTGGGAAGGGAAGGGSAGGAAAAGATDGGTTFDTDDGPADGGDTANGAAAGGASCTGCTGGITGGPTTGSDAAGGTTTEAAGAASTAKPCNG